MSEIKIYLESLLKTFSNSDGNEAKRLVSQIIFLFKAENLTHTEIDSGIICLLKTTHNTSSLLDIIKNYFMQPIYKDAISNILELLSDLLSNYDRKLDPYVEDITSISLKVLRSSCHAEIKLRAILLLSCVVGNTNWSHHVPAIAALTVDQIAFKKNSANILNKQLFLLGMLCEKHPEIMTEYIPKISTTLMNLVSEDISTVKIIFTAKEGMFAAVEGFMSMYDFEQAKVDRVYRCIKTFSNPRDSARKGFARGAVKLLSSKPGSVFSENVCNDLVEWLDVLVKFISSNNFDDRKTGCMGLSKFYEYVGNTLMAKGSCDYSMKRFQHLMKYFKSIISNPPEDREFEYKLALEGFAVVTSKCKNLIGDDEFEKVTGVLVQRSQQIIRNEGESDTVAEGKFIETIEKICMYINALAALGADVKECIMDLTRALISKYPQCPPSRRNHVLFTINKSVFLTDLRVSIPFIVKESCRHSISLSPQYKKRVWQGDMVGDDEATWTYENFVDIWENLLKSHKGKEIFDIYMDHILDIIPCLDYTTKIVPTTMGNDSNDNAGDFEENKIMNNIPEYSFFINLCDLTWTLWSFFATDVFSVEWCLPHLYKIFELTVNGLRGNISATSLLKIAQSALIVSKKLAVFDDGEHEYLKSKICELFKIISIAKSSGYHQLHSALFMLQIPHQILDENTLDMASEAFEVVFRNGKNDLDLISDALDTLNQWDFFIDRDTFRPLCAKLLPIMNDYLCSSGITDGKVLDDERTITSRYEFATRRRRMLLTQGTSQQLETVQLKIMRFLGKMDCETLQCFLKRGTSDVDGNNAIMCDVNEMEDIQLSDLSDKLKISLPCPEQRRIDIYLDSLVSRIKDLSLNSTCRDTRVTACQLLHSIVILIYGTHRSLPASSKVSLANTLSELTTVMLVLSADTDTTIRDMFDPLLTESCHWFTSPANSSSVETEKFLQALMRGAYHPSDSLVREKACLALKEVIKWSIKQSLERDRRAGPLCAAAVMRSICQGIVHTNTYRKRGAFLIFNCVATQVYHIESLVDKFLPEILNATVTCINNNLILDKQYTLYKDEAMMATRILLKCLQSRADLFKMFNPNRRMPAGFGKSVLKDIVLWMLLQSKECHCRETAEKLFKTLIPISKLVVEFKDCGNLIDSLIQSEGYENVVNKYFEPNQMLTSEFFKISNETYLSSVEAIMNHISCVDFHILTHKYAAVNQITLYGNDYIDKSKLFLSAKLIFSLNVNETLMLIRNSDLSTDQKGILEDMLWKYHWKTSELLVRICNINKTSLSELVGTTIVLVVAWLFDYNLWCVANRKGSPKYSILIQNMKEHLDDEKWNIFVDRCENFKKSKIMDIFTSPLNKQNVLSNTSICKYMNDCVVIYKCIDSQKLFYDLKVYEPINIFKNAFLSKNIDVEFRKSLINFILNCNLSQLSDIVQVILESSSTSINSEHILNVDREVLTNYFINHYVEMFSILEENHNLDMKIPAIILTHASEKKCAEDSLLRYTACWMNKVWPCLTEKYNFEILLKYFTLLAIALPAHVDTLYSAQNMGSWLLKELCDVDRDYENKNKLIYLLATVFKSSDDTIVNDELSQALQLITSQFPHKSDEFEVQTPEREKFLSTYRALLETMANSGNFTIFKTIVNISCVDKDHVCEKQIEHKIISLMERLNSHQSYVVLDWLYATFLLKTFDPSIRLNLLNRFLCPALRAASIEALELFYGEHALTIVEKLDKEVNTVKSNEIPLKHLFAEWISSFLLAEVMFSKIPDDIFESPTSKLASHNKKWRSLFSQKCIKVRNVTVPSCDNQESVVEYLRLSRCSAYKCLYCIVITSSDDKDANKLVKKYELLLNNSRDSLLWEGMIDANKQYAFSLEQTCKFKSHSVRSKINSNSTSSTLLLHHAMLSQSLMGGVLQTDEEKRKMLFSQTLQDDILKYDLNTATTRDPFETPLNLPDAQKRTIWMEDLDLLNHEVMPIVCCVLVNIDKITCPADKDMSGSSNSTTPSWVQNYVAVLSDQKRPNNVRLFLSQVMVKLRDNGTDVFKKYAPLCLKPLLHVIQYRCTTTAPDDNNLNFWDVGILFLLLSWKEVAVPSTIEEISAANFIVKALINQINPNTQSLELYKNSLDLLKDILNVWGMYLKIPSEIIILKLQCDTQKLLTSSIQITAVVIASGACPWDNEHQFGVISKILVKLLHSSDSKIYRTSAEVIGLMLQLLHRNATNESSDVDMDSKDYSTFISFTESVRNKMKELKNDKSKFIECLYMMRIHHAQICDSSLMGFVVYLIPKLPIQSKKKCFKIYLSAVEYLDTCWLLDSLVDTNIKAYLKDKDLGVTSLHIMNKLFDRVPLDTLADYLEEISSLGCHKEPEVRAVTYEILMKAYNAILDHGQLTNVTSNIEDDKTLDFLMCSPSMSRKRPAETTFHNDKPSCTDGVTEHGEKYHLSSVKAALLLGVEDEQDDLRQRVCDFWAGKLQNNLQERWLTIISQLCVNKETNNQGNEVERAIRLMLEACKKAPDYETTTLFNDPLENCIHVDYRLDGRHPKKSSLMVPMFAETINSHRQLSHLFRSLNSGDVTRSESLASQIQSKLAAYNCTLLNHEQQMLRATLDSVVFDLSLDSIGRNFGSGNTSIVNPVSDGFSFQEDSSLLFNMDPPLLHRQTYEPLPARKDSSKEAILTSEDKLRRRLISNKNVEKAKFASLAMEKSIRKEQKRLAEKPAPMFRSFRKGDYPDVQIKLDNILAPLIGLASRDHIFSKDLFIVLFKSLLSHCPEDKNIFFKESTSRFILSQLKTRTVPLTVEALLEVCRLCMTSGSQDSNELIRFVAKNNGIDWLGDLLLEELCTNEQSSNRKRIKLKDGKISSSLPPEMISKIRLLKWNNQWDMLRSLYQEATLDQNLDTADKLHCTEESFKCFVNLSDWDGLIVQLKDHLTPDSILDDDSFVDEPFDLNVLWSSKYRKETYLHLVFMAYIQMRAAVDCVYKFSKASKEERDRLKVEIQTFNRYINKWMDEPDKSVVLERRLSPYMSLWRVVNRDHTHETCDVALKWLRQEWSRECSGAAHSRLEEIFNIMLNVSETRNYLDLMCKLSSSRSNEEVMSTSISNIQYIWRQCVSQTSSNTVAWDLRLACRSIFTCQLQNFIKDNLNTVSDSECRYEFTKIQRFAELQLVRSALHQKNIHLARKLMKKHISCVVDADEVFPWQIEEMNLMKLTIERECDLGTKMTSLLDLWIKKETNITSTMDHKHHIGLLNVSWNVADMLCSILTQYSWEECGPLLSSHKDKLDSLLPISEFNKSSLIKSLIEYSSNSLMNCIEIVEKTEKLNMENDDPVKLTVGKIREAKMSKSKVDAYMNVVHYARKAKQDYLNDESNEGLLKLTIIGILKGMLLGEVEARKLFPVLLLDLEKLPENHHLAKLFMKEVALVPCWMFLPWAPQLLAHLPTQCSTLLPLVTRMVQEYPSALRHHYNLSKQMWLIPIMKNIIEKFDELLYDAHISTLMKAICCLKCPWTVLKFYIDRLAENGCDKNKILDELNDEMLTVEFGVSNDLRGHAYHGIRKLIEKLETIRHIDNDAEALIILRDVFKSCEDGQNGLPERCNLHQFSPFLENYPNNVTKGHMEVFGQYDAFSHIPPDPKNHVTITKFHSEVSLYKGSNRRPLRMSLYGSDGKKYSFLVKCGEDLRQDNRIQQTLELMNHPLNQISMHITTYKVFPLTQRIGLIEYVRGYATLRDVICYASPKAKDAMKSVYDSRKTFIERSAGRTLADKYGLLAAPHNMPLNSVDYREKVSSIPNHFLRDSLQKIAGTSEMFVKMKRNFINSLAPMNVAHWVLGIGDRHLSNCMVSLTTGNVLGIDFGHAFGTATQELTVPELMPFRLTPQINAVIATSNQLRELMWQTLNKLCENRNLLLAAMEVFVREPTLDWIKDGSQWQPRHKIDQCKRKLNGVDPITIVIEDLENRVVGREYITNYRDTIKSVAEEQNNLTVDQQIDHLLKLATNDGVMGITYCGWQPHF